MVKISGRYLSFSGFIEDPKLEEKLKNISKEIVHNVEEGFGICIIPSGNSFRISLQNWVKPGIDFRTIDLSDVAKLERAMDNFETWLKDYKLPKNMPSYNEINAIKRFKKDIHDSQKIIGINIKTNSCGDFMFHRDCWDRLLTAYLEKYDKSDSSTSSKEKES